MPFGPFKLVQSFNISTAHRVLLLHAIVYPQPLTGAHCL
jgi:hypothetical protein